jgi:TPP-dependent pyruvate/acetoin dehydrogenase alpha subunit
VFLECMTYRWLEHVGPNFDHELGRTYRTERELREWMERCPVKRSAAALMAGGIASEAELERLDAEILAETEAAAKRARQAPFPPAEQLFENVW